MDTDSPVWPLTREEILQQLFSYQKVLTAYGFSLMNDWQLAEDAVQETILYVAGNHGKYDGERPLLPWARGIVRFKCFAMMRSRKKGIVTEDPENLAKMLDGDLSELWDENAATEMAKRIHALRNCMAELPARACRLLHDFYVKRKPGKDLAEREDMGFSNLRSHLSRLRKRLRDCVSDRLSDADHAEREGYWDVLDEYYGHGQARDVAEVLETVRKVMSEPDGNGRLMRYFIEAASFGLTLQDMRPLAGGMPRRPKASGLKLLTPPLKAPALEGETVLTEMPVVEVKQNRRPWVGVAATLAVCAGIAFWHPWNRLSTADAVVTGMHGEVLRIDPVTGRESVIVIGDRIPPGTKLIAREGSGASFDFHGGKGSEVDVFSNSIVAVGDEANPTANLLRIYAGAFQAGVEKQSERNPLTIVTPNARATVLGTNFLATPDELEVDRGKVRYERLSDGVEVDVPGGSRVAVEDMELTRLPGKDLEEGLVGYWPFEGTGAGLGRDRSGKGTRLDTAGVEPTRGIVGGALAFEGNGFVRGKNNPALAVESEISISVWVKPAAYRERSGLVGKYFGEPTVLGGKSLGRSYSLKLVNGYPELYISSEGDFETTTILRASERLPLNTWTHVVAVFEPSKSMRLYFNGEMDTGRFHDVPDRIMKNESPVLIGAAYSVEAPEDFFSGELDEVRIYAKPLTPGEIAELARRR